jgi:two-component system, LuxR family, response regulator FixJ
MIATDSRGQKPMIFILDDDESVRDSLRLLLECEDLPAREFASGREFLDQVRPAAGDCLLLDLHMPGMSGLEVLEALRRRGDEVPVIIVTGRSTPVAKRRAEAAGILAFVEKPYHVEVLLGLVRDAVKRPRPDGPQ